MYNIYVSKNELNKLKGDKLFMLDRELVDYINNRTAEGLTKIDVSIAADEFSTGDMYVLKTKETYVFDTEEEADNLINDRRQNAGFAAASKKFKAGKMNKNGEVVRPDSWIVVITLRQ